MWRRRSGGEALAEEGRGEEEVSAGGDEFGGGIDDELREPAVGGARVSQGGGASVRRRAGAPIKRPLGLGILASRPSSSAAAASIGGTSSGRRRRHR